jgi:hypothetical protein
VSKELDFLPFIPIYISKKEVEEFNISQILNMINLIDKKVIKPTKKIAIAFSGFENDVREIYQITEIRLWLHRLIALKPHLFYYLSSEAGLMQHYFLCLTQIEHHSFNRITNTLICSTSDGYIMANKIMDAAKYHSLLKKDNKETQDKIVDYIKEGIGMKGQV